MSFVDINKELFDIFLLVREGHQTDGRAVSERLRTIQGRVTSGGCGASLQAYARYLRLISLYLTRLDPDLSPPPQIIEYTPETHQPSGIESIRKALERDPSRYDLLLLLAQSTLIHGDIAKARNLLFRISASRFKESDPAKSMLASLIQERPE